MAAKIYKMEENEMPYAGELKTAYEITEIVGKEQRIAVSDLYPQLSSKNMPTKSHSKRLAEFIGLVKSTGSNVEITDLGRIFVAHRSESERNKLLARSLPKKYETLLRWIKNGKDGEISLAELKTRIVENRIETKTNNRAYDWILQVFGNFSDSIGIISYVKGKSSKFIITDTGREVLHGGAFSKTLIEETPEEFQEIVEHGRESNERVDKRLSGDYPLLIVTNDKKPLEIEISDEVDWEIVDSYIKSLKVSWRKIQESKK